MNEKELFNKYGYSVEFVFNTNEDIDISNVLADCFASFVQRELQDTK